MSGSERLDTAATVFERLMATQNGSGSLLSHISGRAIERSDVLAQALRIGALLRGVDKLLTKALGIRLRFDELQSGPVR